MSARSYSAPLRLAHQAHTKLMVRRHAVGFAACYYNSDEYPGLSQRQQDLPPSASPGASATLWQHAQADHQELLALREVAELQSAKL